VFGFGPAIVYSSTASASVRFEDRGEHELKGVGEAVKVWAVVVNG